MSNPTSPLLQTLDLLLVGVIASTKASMELYHQDPEQSVARELLEQLYLLQSSIRPKAQKPSVFMEAKPEPNFELADSPPSEEQTPETEEDPFSIFEQQPERKELSLFEEKVSSTTENEDLFGLALEETAPQPSHQRSWRESLEDLVTPLQLPETLWELEPEALWQTCHLTLLRLPTNEMQHFHKQLLELAQQQDAQASSQESILLPDIYGAPLSLPSCVFLDVPCRGFSFSKCPIDTELQKLPNQTLSGISLVPWYTIATLLTQLIELDHSLFHALQTAYQFGATLLDEEQKKSFKTHFFSRLMSVSQAKTPEDEMSALWEVDEAMHSVFHIPFASKTSWWQLFYLQSRELLFEAKDFLEKKYNFYIHLQDMPNEYRTIFEKKLTEQDVPLSIGGPPGKVISTLRLGMGLEGKSSRGRVLYHR